MEDDNYYVVHGWMVNQLELKGTDLLIYAIIYGFSQDGRSRFDGSLSYLQKSVHASRPTVVSSLAGLVDRKLIIKYTRTVNRVRLTSYRVNRSEGWLKNLTRGSKKTLPNNKNINIRAKEFWDDVLEVGSQKGYDRAMLREFFEYWREPNRSKTKMKCELQQTFQIAGRLATWARNQKQFGPRNKRVTSQPDQRQPEDIIKARLNGSYVQLMTDNYLAASKLSKLNKETPGQLAAELCELYGWIVNRRPPDALKRTAASWQIKTADGLIGEYIKWLQESDWITGGYSEKIFSPGYENKMFNRFLEEFKQRIGLDPLTGRYV